jgi:hypothetical protein
MRGLLHHSVLSSINCLMRAQNTRMCFVMFSFSLIFNVCTLFLRCIFITTFWDSNNLVNSVQAWCDVDVGDEILLSTKLFIIARDSVSLSSQLLTLLALIAVWLPGAIWAGYWGNRFDLCTCDDRLKTFSVLNNNVNLCFHMSKYVPSNFRI